MGHRVRAWLHNSPSASHPSASSSVPASTSARISLSGVASALVCFRLGQSIGQSLGRGLGQVARPRPRPCATPWPRLRRLRPKCWPWPRPWSKFRRPGLSQDLGQGFYPWPRPRQGLGQGFGGPEVSATALAKASRENPRAHQDGPLDTPTRCGSRGKEHN